MVDDALASGTPPQKIAFLAFTRKAAEEAKERASARFGLDPKKDLVYFRTLHSLSLMLTDIRTEQIMQQEHYREISLACGVPLVAGKTRDELHDQLKSSDPILSLINLARLRKVPLREQYNITDIDHDWITVNHVARTLDQYKTQLHMFDFTDMLSVFIEQAPRFCPYFDLVFLDEAQDLSPLQWDIAHILDENASRMYVAGDDDQAIYRWAGADVDHFINLPGGSETLSQSYRVPRAVHRVAQSIAGRINRRFPKSYEPREQIGSVTYVSTLDQIDMAEGTWLVLAQAGYQLEPVANDLKSNGFLFNYRGSRSISEKISDAVNGWERLRKGREISGATARNIYSYMSSNKRIRRGFKKLPGLEDTDIVTLADLRDKHGLVADGDMIWHDAMDQLPETDRAYIVAMLRRGERFNGTPRITVSTIHGSKGGEADNVVVFTDLSPAADDSFRKDPDDLHRTFYVAVTRTKNSLFIVSPEDVSRSYDI